MQIKFYFLVFSVPWRLVLISTFLLAASVVLHHIFKPTIFCDSFQNKNENINFSNNLKTVKNNCVPCPLNGRCLAGILKCNAPKYTRMGDDCVKNEVRNFKEIK